MDGGAYCTLTPVVLSRGALHAAGPYRCPNVRVRARATRTNTPPNGAFRGFGAPQVEFAMETQLNRVAERLGMSPAEIRRRNAYQLGDTTATGQVLRESVAAQEVLRLAVEAADFERIRAATALERGGAPWLGRGARRAASGRAPPGPRPGSGSRSAGTAPGSPARARSTSGPWRRSSSPRRGASASSIGATEMGQGTTTIFPLMVVERARRHDRCRRDGAGGHGRGPGQRAHGREPDRDGGRRAVHRRRAPAPGRGRGAQRRPAVRRGLPRRRARATAGPGSTSGSSRTRGSSSTTRPTGGTPTRSSAGRPAWPSSTWTSTPAR